MANHLSMANIQAIAALHQSGHSNRHIARVLGINRVNWREEALALQMLLEWYGQSDDYLFGVEWIAENILVFARKSPDLLGNCFDFWSTIPDPMTVNQAVLIALMTQNIDEWNQENIRVICEKLENEEVSGRYEFVKEW